MAVPVPPAASVNGDFANSTPPPAVDPSLLPSSASQDLFLAPATPVEWVQCQRLNAEEWKGPLSIEQYLARENHLFSQTLTRDGKGTGWILTSHKLPLNDDGTRKILASCETILANSYVARDGVVEKVSTHGIGSVFTRKEHRGKGYAGTMMTELGKQLETWQQPNGKKNRFSVLYSDIGSNFYSRFGWKAFPSTHIHTHPMDAQAYKKASNSLPKVDDLTAKEIARLPATEYVEQEILHQSKVRPSATFVAIQPDVDHFEWQHAREEFVASALGKPFPKLKGAIHRPTGIAMIWNRIFAVNNHDCQLHILHTIIPPEMKGSIKGLNALSALILRVQLEASEWGMAGGVEIWDPSEDIVAAAQNLRVEAHDKVEVIHRDKEHVCSLRWFGPGGKDADVVWEYNQKYAWC